MATGPLTSQGLSGSSAAVRGSLSFFDAAAPIVTRESLDMGGVSPRPALAKVTWMGEEGTTSTPHEQGKYDWFVEELVNAERARPQL